MNKRVRYTVNDVNQSKFYQMPKFLFEAEFKEISNDARVLYSLLRDRHELSIVNGWINEENEVYLIFTRESMSRELGLSKPTIIKAMDQLKKFGLVEEERQGRRKPNLIYLNSVTIGNPLKSNIFTSKSNPVPIENTLRSNIFTSRSKNSLPLEVKNFYPNDTNINNTNINNTNINDTENIYISQSVIEKEIEMENNLINNRTDGQTYKAKDINQIIKKIETRLDINSIKEAYPHDLKLIDEIMLNIFDMYFSDYTTIQGQNKPRELVRAAIMKLNFFHIQELLSKYREISTTTQIKNPKAYIQSMIYNIAFENDLAVTNKIGYEWG